MAKKQSQIAKARARMERMQKGEGGKDFLSLATGKNVVRILPGKREDDDWYVEAAYHYFNVNGNKITKLCPAFVNRKCPACSKSAQARKKAYKYKDQYEKGGEKSLRLKKLMEKAFRIASTYKAKNKFYMNAIPIMLGKETQSGKEVKVFGAGAKVMNGIFTFYTDTDEYGNVLDLKRGRDFIVEKKVTGKKAWDIDYDVKLRDKDRCKPVHPNRLKDLRDIGALVGEYPDADEILAAMEGRDESSSDESSDDDDRAQRKLSSKKKRRRDDDDEDEDLEDDEDESEGSDEEDEDEDERSGYRPKKKSKVRDKLRRRARD